MSYKATAQPQLRSPLLTSAEPELLDLLKQLAEWHGVGSNLPTETGGLLPIRINTETLVLEAYRGNKWQAVTQSGSDSGNSSSGFAVESVAGKLVDVPLVLSDSLSVGGSVGFYGATPAAKTAIADPSAMGNADGEIDGVTINDAMNGVTPLNADGEISGLTFSAAYVQSEVEALRDKCEEVADDVRSVAANAAKKADVESALDKCEELADDVRAIHSKLTDLINALQATGLV